MTKILTAVAFALALAASNLAVAQVMQSRTCIQLAGGGYYCY